MSFICANSTVEIGEKPVIMGILNVTPDSFHDSGKYFNLSDSVSRAYEIQAQGADILDIGAQSTRPGHTKISAEEELERLTPVLERLGDIKIPISVDTYYPLVARECLRMGADIINDVSGTVNEEMIKTVASFSAGYVVMHTGFDGEDISKDMKSKDMRAVDESTPICGQVDVFFRKIVGECERLGLSREHICADVGIGFGKSFLQNKELLTYKPAEDLADLPLLIGVSHKRVVRQMFGDDTLAGTLKCNALAYGAGFNIFRVHDVKEHMDWIKSL